MSAALRQPYRAPKVSGTVATEVEQGLFDFLVPYRKPTLLPFEAAICLGHRRKVQFVYDLIELGDLESIAQAAKGKRPVYVVTRRSVLLYLVSRFNGERADFLTALRSLFETLDRGTLDFCLQTLTALRAGARR